VQIDEEKLLGILKWPVLTKVKQVQAFLGFANFYRRFIENFVSQIRYSLVVILELSGVSEVQYKKVMMIDDKKYQ